MDDKSQWRYLQGVKHERNRIIALIREEEKRAPYRDFHPNEIIALIESESAKLSTGTPQKLTLIQPEKISKLMKKNK